MDAPNIFPKSIFQCTVLLLCFRPAKIFIYHLLPFPISSILIATHQPLNTLLRFLRLSKWGCYPFCSLLKKVSQFIVSILKLMAVDRISKGVNFVWPSSSECSVNSWRGHPPRIFAVNHGFILLLALVVICQMHLPFLVKILYKQNHEFV